jgi:type II secretory ATPase GspE/PulE/Tfp pilus assembly ATPase PilB-like protein
MGTGNGSSAVAVVERLLLSARALGASDLHLDPTEEGVRVVARRDGVLEELETLPADLGPRLVGRLKALADLLAYRTDVPQEGRVAPERSGVGVELRVATFPTLLGERVALRFDAPDGTPTDLHALGLSKATESALRASMEQPDGVVLLTGPSGSGKTTTLYACLHHLVAQAVPRSLFTLEDPIERRVRGVTQTQVNGGSELTFARALRSLLRQDPDVILVGEIRDRETAAIALEAGLTGHLVASTVHAGTCPQVYTRLLEMGVEPFVATTAIRGVLSQRLLRRVATDGSGYAGRVLVAEWLPTSPALRAAILRRADAEALAAAASTDGHLSLRAEAERLVADGITTQEEVDRVLGTD